MSIVSGQQVRHSKLGGGIVREVQGDRARVNFRSIGAERWVPLAEVQQVGDVVKTPEVGVVPKGPSIGTILPRLRVECLRQGLPPPGELLSFTVGFDSPRQQVDQALAEAGRRGCGTTYLVQAEYGRGKSHFARICQELAREHHFLTMNAELDGQATTLREGPGLLYRLFSSLMLPPPAGEVMIPAPPGLAALLSRYAERPASRPQEGLEEFWPFLQYGQLWLGDEDATDIIERYLAGERSKADAQKQLRELLEEPITLEPLRLNYKGDGLDSLLAAQVEQISRVVRLGQKVGCRGGLLILDELDHEFGGETQRKQRERSRAFLDVLAEYSENEPLVVILFATPEIEELEDLGTELDLPLLDGADLKNVTRRAVEAYQRAFPAHPTPSPDDVFAKLHKCYRSRYQDSGWGARFFVRGAIEACEVHASGGQAHFV